MNKQLTTLHTASQHMKTSTVIIDQS